MNNKALADIARLHGDLLIAKHLNNIEGPNTWDQIGPEDFGPQHDFDLENHITTVVLDCYSNAALQWCYKHLPEDCPRWGATGFVIESHYIEGIILAMEVDGLMSRTAYDWAMAEEQELQHAQWSEQ